MNHNVQEGVVALYDEATEDYLFWSKDYNMHFGYYRFLNTNPFKRDSMLNEMNQQVYKRLNIGSANFMLADMGCGMGATMKHGLKQYPNLTVTGLTLAPFQVKEGNKLLAGYKGTILNANYNETGFEDNYFNGVVAIESFCHSGHSYKTLKEAHRVLKPGAKMVIADAFLKKPKHNLFFSANYAYQKLCEGWSLEGLGDIKTIEMHLKKLGFKNIGIEDISFRVAPSVLHVPFAITGFMIRKKLKREPIKPQSLNNLKGSFYALLSGLHLSAFGYYLITCEKI